MDFFLLAWGDKQAGICAGEKAMSAAWPLLEALRACSACAGDYEDPERTAPAEEVSEDEEQAGASESARRDGFPVQSGPQEGGGDDAKKDDANKDGA